MRFLRFFAFSSLLLASLACSKDPKGASDVDSIKIMDTAATIYVGEEFTLSVSARVFNGVYAVNKDYDMAANPAGVKFSSSDPSVATVSERGVVKGLSVGEATITATAKSLTVEGSFVINVKNKDNVKHTFSQDMTQPLTKDMLFLPVGITHTTLQGFDIDRFGNVYMAWEENENVHVRKMTGAPVADMILPTGGHGDGFCIEQDKDEVYFWTSGSLGEPNGGFSGAKANDAAVRLICRYKFEAGKTVYPEDAVECYYINDNGSRITSVDTEHNIFATWTLENGVECVRIYTLKAIKGGSKVTKDVTRATRHADSVTAYDLGSAPMLNKFSWDRKVVCGVSDGSTNAIQGFCVYDDKVYVEAGFKNDPASTISVLDFNGKLLQTRVNVGVSADKNVLKELNVSSDGTFEPEGVQIHNGEMYLGFVGDYPTAGSKKHSCVIKLKD